MEYRRLGSSGLRVSAIGYGSWATLAEVTEYDEALACLRLARELGINFLDTAEAYAKGGAERFIGRALRDLHWPRWSAVVSTKLYWGTHDDVNMQQTLNRKYLLNGIDESLERLQLDFVDILSCHRPDPEMPISEIVWTMSDIVVSGKSLYWGTSEWPPELVVEAHEFANNNRLRPPVVEQPQYNIIHRRHLEENCFDLVAKLGLGFVTWSPLASGLLTGKYLKGVPVGSRLSHSSYAWLLSALTAVGADLFIRDLTNLAHRYEVSAAQLSIAWCLSNPAVSSVILGASTADQLAENVQALNLFQSLPNKGAVLRDDVAALVAAHNLAAELAT